MASLDNERFYPVPPDIAFLALQIGVDVWRCKIKHADDFTKSLTFSTPPRGASWGATYSAQARAVEGGTLVTITGEQQLRVNLTSRGTEGKQLRRILDATSDAIQGRLK